MDFKTLANARYSVRDFSSKKIEDEKINIILETARKAPSAVNFQPYKLFVVKSEEKLNAVKDCYHRSWIKNAPLVMVVVSTHQMAWKRAVDMKDFSDIDSAIFIDHIMLQATDLGLGTCWVCNFEIEKLIERFYSIISGKKEEDRDWNSFKSLFFTNSHLMSVKYNSNNECITTPQDVESYIIRLEKFLRTNDFYEYGFNYKINVLGNIAYVYSEYEAKTSLECNIPLKTGVNLVQLVKHDNKWKIINMLWEDK